jgi:hypothetical protein
MTLDTELTPIGEQTLIAGVRPITGRDRLQMRLSAPLQPRCRQRPLNVGLWDEDARNQLELFTSPPGLPIPQ